VVLISGNIPYKTEVAAVYIFGQVETDNPGSAAAVSIVLLVSSLALLATFDLIRRRISRHEAMA
jgi:sulfate transport system permease protein